MQVSLGVHLGIPLQLSDSGLPKTDRNMVASTLEGVLERFRVNFEIYGLGHTDQPTEHLERKRLALRESVRELQAQESETKSVLDQQEETLNTAVRIALETVEFAGEVQSSYIEFQLRHMTDVAMIPVVRPWPTFRALHAMHKSLGKLSFDRFRGAYEGILDLAFTERAKEWVGQCEHAVFGLKCLITYLKDANESTQFAWDMASGMTPSDQVNLVAQALLQLKSSRWGLDRSELKKAYELLTSDAWKDELEIPERFLKTREILCAWLERERRKEGKFAQAFTPITYLHALPSLGFTPQFQKEVTSLIHQDQYLVSDLMRDPLAKQMVEPVLIHAARNPDKGSEFEKMTTALTEVPDQELIPTLIQTGRDCLISLPGPGEKPSWLAFHKRDGVLHVFDTVPKMEGEEELDPRLLKAAVELIHYAWTLPGTEFIRFGKGGCNTTCELMRQLKKFEDTLGIAVGEAESGWVRLWN